MAKRKKRYPTPPGMKYRKEFEKYLAKPEKNKVIKGSKFLGFNLINQLPLYRIDNLETVEL